MKTVDIIQQILINNERNPGPDKLISIYANTVAICSNVIHISVSKENISKEKIEEAITSILRLRYSGRTRVASVTYPDGVTMIYDEESVFLGIVYPISAPNTEGNIEYVFQLIVAHESTQSEVMKIINSI